jgi:hypothetical protein
MKRLLLASLVVGMTAVGTAQAGPVTYTFQGTIQHSTATGINVNDAFTVTLVYDAEATRTSGGTNYSDFSSSLASLAATVGGQTYQGISPLKYYAMTNVGVSVFAGQGDVLQFIQDFTPTGPFGTYSRGLSLSFVSPYPSGILTGNASVLPASLSSFEFVQFSLRAWEGYGVGLKYADGLATPVPDPGATLLLLGMGLGGLGAAKRRRVWAGFHCRRRHD